MSSVTVYIVNNDGSFDCARTGDVNSVMLAVDIEQKEFTMLAPPDMAKPYFWVGDEWVLKPPIEE